ncbi:MAG: glycosyltransferase [Gemmatimonadales bacterium]|nr:glycosyltransferase [Gemmatimonadales bacterium]
MRRKTTTLCIIAKNEEATIGMAIKSVLALVDEMILVDTGSTDNTRIIAEGYGARVLDVPWEDDFSLARNAALEEATGDWILVLDADEFLEPIRPVEFQRLLNDQQAGGFRLRVSSGREDGPARLSLSVRLFRSDPDLRYIYPIHEQIEPALERWVADQGLAVLDSDLTVIHDGQRLERLIQGRERNLRILRKALLAHPQEPYFPYRLACESISLLGAEVLPVVGLKSVLGHLHQSWTRVEGLGPQGLRDLIWAPDLGAKISSSLLAVDRVEEARVVIRKLADIYPDDPRILLQSIAADTQYLQFKVGELADQTTAEIITLARRKLNRLRSLAKAESDDPELRRMTDLYPLRYEGELALLEGHVSDAVGFFEQALGQDPSYSFAWLGMAECSRFAGDNKRALKLYLRTITESEHNHRAWLRGCDLMREMDFRDNAESWWRKVVTLFPEHPEVARQRSRENDRETISS